MVMSPEVKARYAEIRTAAESALTKAHGSAECRHDAVNWGDLGVVAVEGYFDDTGDEGVRVYVEEVSPDAHGLRNFVREELRAAGFPDIAVITEW